MAHALQNTWVLWEHKALAKGEDWNQSMKEVCEFSTAEQFWRCWSFIPRPSEVFHGGSSRREIARTLDGFSVFKKGIRPEWEDTANCNGSEYKTVRHIHAGDVDSHWENLVLSLIGEVIDEGNEVCGCRVVDKSRKDRAQFRLELWLRGNDEVVGNTIKARMLDALVDGNTSGKARLPEFERKSRQE